MNKLTKNPIALPKQWKDWCTRMNLRPSYSYHNRAIRNWMYLVGRNRVWRINNRYVFQIGEERCDFDRWANSTIYGQPLVAKNFHEFQKMILRLEKIAEYGIELPDGDTIPLDRLGVEYTRDYIQNFTLRIFRGEEGTVLEVPALGNPIGQINDHDVRGYWTDIRQILAEWMCDNSYNIHRAMETLNKHYTVF